MKKSVYILFEIHYTIIKGRERGYIHLKSLSPKIINQKLKFTILKEEKQSYNFDQLAEKLKFYYFTRKQFEIVLSVINQETSKEQQFGIDISKLWPEGLAEDKIIVSRTYIEITKCLEEIGIL